MVIYGSERTSWDDANGIKLGFQKVSPILQYENWEFPIYGTVSTFQKESKSLLRMKRTTEPVGIEVDAGNKIILRIGLNLFEEISFLLSSGQPTKFAGVPTLEIHISMLRNWILAAGTPVVEICPAPWGYDFLACLTHDVDFVGLRNHRLDHTVLGFVYRASFGSFIELLRHRISWYELLRNWQAVLLLPFVYLGIADDFWVQFQRYMEIEKGLGSTFFFLPFKKMAGTMGVEKAPKKRAGKYDLEGVKKDIEVLISRGCEVGLHGIDAWQDADKARQELAQISSVIGESNIGVRIHWLYFNERSAATLDSAGAFYDSTIGYNDAVGYRTGTTQVFRPLGAQKLLELPLNMQDTAIFYPNRMGLRKKEAFKLCKELIRATKEFGGVLVINWHHRSLAPDRLWEDFYFALLEELKANNVYFGTAKQVITWFGDRRRLTFVDVEHNGNRICVRLANNRNTTKLLFKLRAHMPESRKSVDVPIGQDSNKCFDIHA